MRVASTRDPGRPQRGPHTGRGARTDGVVGDRTRIFKTEALFFWEPVGCLTEGFHVGGYDHAQKQRKRIHVEGGSS